MIKINGQVPTRPVPKPIIYKPIPGPIPIRPIPYRQ